MTTTRKPRKTSKKAEAIQTRKATPQPITNLPPNPFTFEVLSLVVKQRSNAKKGSARVGIRVNAVSDEPRETRTDVAWKAS